MKMPLSLWLLKGGLAQLARALGWQSRGHRFESDILHTKEVNGNWLPFLLLQQTFKASLNFLSS